MSERKVLNKYYPPDFDPSKIPKLKLPRNRQYSIRIMAPFNMRCSTCGEYIYKGKKFNSRKETVEDEDYLGLRIFRFYIKCPRCVSEIAFKTDPQNTDYSLEDGATRNFEAAKTAERLAKIEQQEKEEEEANNPMKVLENRTKASRNEMEMIENLEELRDLNSRHAKIDHEQMLKMHQVYDEQLKRLQEEEDENLVKKVFGTDGSVKRLADSDSDDEQQPSQPKFKKLEKPTDILTQNTTTDQKNKPSWQKTPGTGSKINLRGLVKRKVSNSAVKSSEGRSDREKSADTNSSGHNTGSEVSKETSQSDQGEETSERTVACGKESTSNDTKSVDKEQEITVDGSPLVSKQDDSGTKTKPVALGLSLLGNYSDSSGETDSD